MDSLLKTVGSITVGNKKAMLLIRDTLQTQLNASVMEVHTIHDPEGDGINNCEEATTLCAVLEALFLHGLKDSLLNRVTQALSSPDFDAMPQPSFWGPLLVFSHRQVIKQIQSLSQITTEVGYCRAWIRQTLNDGTLANYLCHIGRDNSALKPYYNRWAFVRDPDLVEVAQRLMETLEHVSFKLVCNSSLLNTWSNTPLILSGVWSPPLKSCPIVSAVDIAKTITSEQAIDETVETASSIGSSIGIESFNSSQSAFNNVACITEDTALRIILANNRSDGGIICELSASPDNNGTRRNDAVQRSSDNSPDTRVQKEQGKQEAEQASNGDAEQRDANIDSVVGGTLPQSDDASSRVNEVVNDAAAANVGNSLIGKLGWSTSFDDCQSTFNSPVISEPGPKGPRTPGDGISYEALIESYQNAHGTPPEVRDFVERYKTKRRSEEEDSKAELSKQKVLLSNTCFCAFHFPVQVQVQALSIQCLSLSFTSSGWD